MFVDVIFPGIYTFLAYKVNANVVFSIEKNNMRMCVYY